MNADRPLRNVGRIRIGLGAQMDMSTRELHASMHTHTHTRRRGDVTRSNDTGAALSVRLTALSPSGRAPLSSQHSFRYLAETFSLCLPFSKTCFMLGAPSAVVLLTSPLSVVLSFPPLYLILSAHTSLSKLAWPPSPPHPSIAPPLTSSPSQKSELKVHIVKRCLSEIGEQRCQTCKSRCVTFRQEVD